jgi:4-hydroxy-tetrahydrodipicolinate synthase
MIFGGNVNWTCIIRACQPHVMDLTGLYVPLITPFTPAGELADDALEGLAHEVLDDGAAGIVALGTTGEPATLTEDERHRVLDVCARVCRERSATLIAAAGSNDTAASARALAGLAGWPEIAAALTVVPYYTRPSEAGVVAHFTELAAVSPVPLVIYNIPYRTGQTVGWGALRRLAELPGITGVKQAVGGVDTDTVMLLADLPEGFAVLCGEDVFASALLALGAHGGIMASAHVCTQGFAGLIAAWQSGAADRARALGHRLAPVAAALFAEPNPTVIKGVLCAQGRIPSPAVRLPLLPASAMSITAAQEAVEVFSADGACAGGEAGGAASAGGGLADGGSAAEAEPAAEAAA